MMNSAWHFLNPTGGLDPILRGLVGPKAKLNTQEHMMHDELRERLFKFSSELALDLAALSLQRGRDHGLPRTRLLMCYLSPSYHGQHFPTLPLFRLQWMEEVLRAVTLPSNVMELAAVMHNTVVAEKLLDLYKTPDKIDVWLGGVAEPFVPGGRVGPLFACLISTQFQRIHQGDRYCTW